MHFCAHIAASSAAAAAASEYAHKRSLLRGAPTEAGEFNASNDLFRGGKVERPLHAAAAVADDATHRVNDQAGRIASATTHLKYKLAAWLCGLAFVCVHSMRCHAFENICSGLFIYSQIVLPKLMRRECAT